MCHLWKVSIFTFIILIIKNKNVCSLLIFAYFLLTDLEKENLQNMKRKLTGNLRLQSNNRIVFVTLTEGSCEGVTRTQKAMNLILPAFLQIPPLAPPFPTNTRSANMPSLKAYFQFIKRLQWKSEDMKHNNWKYHACISIIIATLLIFHDLSSIVM